MTRPLPLCTKYRRYIVFDMDDTICHFVPSVIALIQLTFNKTVEISRLGPSWLKDVLTQDEWEHLQTLIYRPEFYQVLLPHSRPGEMADTFRWLQHQQGLGLHLLTARQAPLACPSL